MILSTSQAQSADVIEVSLQHAIRTANLLASELQYTLQRFHEARTQSHGEFPSAWLLAEYAQSASLTTISGATTRLDQLTGSLADAALRLGRGA